jgi:putative chitinase
MNLSNLKIEPIVMTEIKTVVEKFNGNTSLRLAHFIAQCAHESGNFKLVSENLNYSAKSLRAVFGKYFPNEALAAAYERKPEKIANLVYGNRMGNGNELSGDGFRFRGRGIIQLTGKDNYKAFSDFIGEDCVANPELIATKYPLASAAFFFNKNNLWQICDKGATSDVVLLVTKRVNGGTNGLQDRVNHFNSFYNMING